MVSQDTLGGIHSEYEFKKQAPKPKPGIFFTPEELGLVKPKNEAKEEKTAPVTSKS